MPTFLFGVASRGDGGGARGTTGDGGETRGRSGGVSTEFFLLKTLLISSRL